MCSVTFGVHTGIFRHGQTVWHADNRYAGHASDVDLMQRKGA